MQNSTINKKWKDDVEMEMDWGKQLIFWHLSKQIIVQHI